MWILETDGPSQMRGDVPSPRGSVKTIGRSTGAEFIVDAALVSRLHCQLTATADRLQVKDLDSTNGTFVNGKADYDRPSCTDGDRSGCGARRAESVAVRPNLPSQKRVRAALLPDRRRRTVARIDPRVVAERQTAPL